jgi:hypothetical protein
MLIPIVVLTIFTLVQLSTVENGFALHEARSRKLSYLAQSGSRIAFFSMAAGNFLWSTHESDGVTAAPSATLLTCDVPGVTLDPTTGWYVWRWQPGDPPDQSYTGDGNPQSFRFQVYYPIAGTYRIVCQATLGGQTEVQTVNGLVGSAYAWAWLANGDLSDLCRNSSFSLTGPVQANGNAWFCPMEADATLALASDKIQVAGDAIRYCDAWGNPDGRGSVTISKGSQTGTPTLMNGAAQGAFGQNNAFDCFNVAWPQTDTNGAIGVFGGVLSDQTLGASAVIPSSAAFAPGGYYDRTADLHIIPGMKASWIGKESFTNDATGQQVTLAVLNVPLLGAIGKWPKNGVIYATTPIALEHAENLPKPLTVASDCAIYIHGSFNRKFSTVPQQAEWLANGTSFNKPAAIMTSDRLFFLSDEWSDTASGMPVGGPLPLYAGDYNAANRIWEVNGALADGAPAVDMVGWVPSWHGTANPSYQPTGDPHTEPFLEDLTGVTWQQTGSTIRLQNASMAAFDNSDAGPGVTPWIVQHAYVEPNWKYTWDPSLASAPPPGGLNTGTQMTWQQSSPTVP